MTNLGDLSVQIRADTTQLQRALPQFRRFDTAIKRQARSYDDVARTAARSASAQAQSFRRVQQSAQQTQRSFIGLKGAIAALGVGLLARNIIGTAASFETLRNRLITVTGSTEKAADAFDKLSDFATATPFELQNIVEAYTQLQAVGIDPTIERLTAFGDAASAFGRDITDFSQAVIGAVTGETERLKAFGVVARQQGDQITFIFNGMEKTIKKDAQSIVSFLEEMAASRFGGAMEREANTVRGAFSNLSDAWDQFADAVGRAGLNQALVDLARQLTSSVEGSDDLAKSFGRISSAAVNATTEIAKLISETEKWISGDFSKWVADVLHPDPTTLDENIAQLTERLRELKREREELRQLDPGSKVINFITGDVSTQAEAFNDVSIAIRNVAFTLARANQAATQVKFSLKDVGESLPVDMFQSFTGEVTKIVDTARKGEDQWKKWADVIGFVGKQIDATNAANERFRSNIDEMAQRVREARQIEQDAFNEMSRKQGELVITHPDIAKQDEFDAFLTRQIDQTQALALAAGNVESAFVSAFTNAATGAETLREAAFQLVTAIQRIIAQLLIELAIRQIINALGGGVGMSPTSGASGAAVGKGFSQLLGAQHGLQGKVAGTGGADSKLLPLKVSPGELVSVMTPQQQAAQSSGPTVFIDARGSDRQGYEELKAMIRAVNGSVEERAVSAVYDWGRRRNRR